MEKIRILRVVALDQFGNAMQSQPSFTWRVQSQEQVANSTVSGSNSDATVSFQHAGRARVFVAANGIETSTVLWVKQKLSDIKVFTANGSELVNGSTLQTNNLQLDFRVAALDQFGDKFPLTRGWNWRVTSANREASSSLTAEGDSAALKLSFYETFNVRLRGDSSEFNFAIKAVRPEPVVVPPPAASTSLMAGTANNSSSALLQEPAGKFLREVRVSNSTS